jgi:hypothetical protein
MHGAEFAGLDSLVRRHFAHRIARFSAPANSRKRHRFQVSETRRIAETRPRRYRGRDGRQEWKVVPRLRFGAPWMRCHPLALQRQVEKDDSL